MKVILVPVADRPECKVALQQAFRIAADLGANINGCHLRLHRSDAPAGRRPHYHLHVGRSQDASAEGSRRSAESARKAAHRLFVESAEEHGFRLVKRPRLGMERGAQWFEMVGALDRLFSIAGPVADASVVSRPGRNAAGRGADFLLSAVLHSGRPVLVLPPTPVAKLGRRILIAWNQNVEAARAVSAAIPLLQRADSVHICSAGSESLAGPKAATLAQYLNCWGVKCTRSMSKGRDVPREIDEAYNNTGSDLIVMGAYSRSRMREVVFGGVTQHMLYQTRHPVFVLHS